MSDSLLVKARLKVVSEWKSARRMGLHSGCEICSERE